MSAQATRHYSRDPAIVHVEYEHGLHVGFVIDGGKLERVIETRDRKEARARAEARAAVINRQRAAVAA